MIRITLLWPGKTREPWLQEGISRYAEKLGYYYQLKVVETRAKGSAGQGKRAGKRASKKAGRHVEQEGQALLKALPKGARVVALDIRGKTMNSEALARFLQKEADSGTRDLCFIIGGAYGLSHEVLKAAHLRLSLSPMTFTHDMSRLILLEQLYRAATINAAEPYHH